MFCTVPQYEIKTNVSLSIGDVHICNNKIPNAVKHTWFQICLQFLLNLLISVTSVQKWANLRHFFSHYILKCLGVWELVIVPWNLVAVFCISLMLNRERNLSKDVNISVCLPRIRIDFPSLERNPPEWQRNDKVVLSDSIFQKTKKI